jgi:hypothetical protein
LKKGDRAVSTPLWQVWSDLALKALGAGATFLAVLVALFGARLRHWLMPPRLKITLASAEGYPSVLHTLNLLTNQATVTEGFWYHVRVENEARWSPATGVYIFVSLIEAPDAAGDYQPVWSGQAALHWRHDTSTDPKTVGYVAQGDLCHILRSPPEVRLSPLTPGALAPERFTGEFRVRLTLQARGVEADSKPLRIEISWNGQWADDIDGMKRRLVVKPV